MRASAQALRAKLFGCLNLFELLDFTPLPLDLTLLPRDLDLKPVLRFIAGLQLMADDSAGHGADSAADQPFTG